mgnify:CR=1 FL=1
MVGAQEKRTSSSDEDVVSGLGVGLLDRLPDGHTGAENGSRLGHVESVGDGGEVAGEGDGVSACTQESIWSSCKIQGTRNALLEGTIDRVSRGLGLLASRLLALAADLAVEAGVGKPLDTDGVSDLQVGGGVVCVGTH